VEGGWPRLALRFRVERYWKGVKAREEVVYAGESDCDHRFTVGAKYLVYARGKDRSTGCTRTRKAGEAEQDLPALGIRTDV